MKFNMSVKYLSENNFKEEVLENGGTVLVDFFADWCGPCQMMSPVIDQIAEELDNITVGKVNVDQNQELAIEYDVMNIPTLIIFKDGKPVKTIIGLQSKSELTNILQSFANGGE